MRYVTYYDTFLGGPFDVEIHDGKDEAVAKRDCEYPKAQSLDADKLTGKTISGLATDLRQIAKYHYARGNIVQGQFARVMADRIEAAAKREAVTVHGLGNAAAMHDALKKVSRWLDGGLAYCHRRRVGEVVQVPAISGFYVLDAVNAALAAPPRNCDRFADEMDAQLAFLNEVWMISIDRETMTEQDAYENWTDEMRTRYGRWLYAPATWQKGETDGSK